MNHSYWSKKDLEYIWHPCSQMKDYETLPPIVVDHGKGVNLYDVDGKRYLDVVSSWWCNLLGHSHPKINRAIKEQLDSLEHVIFANFSHRPAIILCEELMKKIPRGLCKFNFSDNGSASIESAMKMSFQYHYQTGNRQKVRFMSLSDAYHGETLGALSAGGLDLYSELYKPLLLDIVRIPAPDCYRCPKGNKRGCCQAECIDAAQEAFARHGDECAALLVEPLLQGSAGMRMYPPAYLAKLRSLCDAYNVHLIADEIATGFGRTGSMFACDQAGISPDIMCVSKGLTGGYMPMSITITTQKIYDAFYADYREGKAFMHSHTYSGNPLGCSAALAVLKVLDEEHIIPRAQEKAPLFRQMIVEALGDHPHVGEIRSLGLVNAIELVENRETKKAFRPSSGWGTGFTGKPLNRDFCFAPWATSCISIPPSSFLRRKWRKPYPSALPASAKCWDKRSSGTTRRTVLF